MKSIILISALSILVIFCNAQNDPPIAVPDTVSVMAEDTVAIQVLLNDYDPDGDNIHVRSAWGSQHGEDWDDNDSLVFYRSNYYFGQDSLRYDIMDDGSPPEYSELVPIYINVIENPNLPFAEDDYATTISQVPVEINLLENDIDPNGEEIMILDIEWVPNGTIEIISDSTIIYTSNYFTGIDSIKYRIVEQNTGKDYFSNWATIYISVQENPDIPIGVEDYANAIAFEPIEINVLSNDTDPQGEPIQIFDIYAINAYEIIFNDSIITYKSKPDIVGEYIIEYRIRETGDTTIYSDWITVYINISANPGLPQVVNDYIEMQAGIPSIINVIENDYNPTSDTIFIDTYNVYFGGNVEVLSDSTFKYTPWFSANGADSLEYSIRRKSDYMIVSSGYLVINVKPNHSYEILDINNINAGVNSSGYLFDRIEELPGIARDDLFASFEAPAGSGMHSIFANTLWIGGKDEFDSIHLAGERYRSGYDYWYGPVSLIYDEQYDEIWKQVWKLNKEDIIYHKNHYWEPGYEIKENILTWPGNGDLNLSQSEHIAPYFDKNNNEIYEPLQGEYPLIRGDQAVFFIFNDERYFHSETEGEKLGVEVHGMAYAFEDSSDSALFNTIFVHYDIINRSDTTYHNTFIGSFTDLDIGNAADDYVISDVQRGAYYGYNGNDYDNIYLGSPPAQGVTILGGAFMDNDNIDNPSGGCDLSINGLNFENDIVDDERYGMTRFVAFDNGNYSQPTTDPKYALGYYGYLGGLWKDNSSILYGGNGHISSGAEGPECRFVFPGSSDTCNWGTGGQLPNGGYNQNDLYWTEETVGNYPDDRRGVGITGPFTFNPGDIQEFDLAFTFARDYDSKDPMGSLELLKQRIDSIRGYVIEKNIIDIPETLGIYQKDYNSSNILIYPNPVSSQLHFTTMIKEQKAVYSIKNISGITIAKGQLQNGQHHTIKIENLEKGIYLIYINCDEKLLISKFIKM